MSPLSSPPVASPVGKIYTAPPPARGALEPLFLPRSVAVIGATDRPGTVGRSVLRNLLESKFPLKIYPVNPSHPEVAGIKAEKRIGDIPGGVDLAVVVSGSDGGPKMPTKRRRIGPKRINQPVPLWAQQLLNGERPDRRDPEVEAGTFAWLLGDPVPGLPPYDSDEGASLRERVGGGL